MNIDNTMRNYYRFDPETKLGMALCAIDITADHNIGIDMTDLHDVMEEDIKCGNYEDQDYIAFHMQEFDAQLGEGHLVTIRWCYRSDDEPGLFARIRRALPDVEIEDYLQNRKLPQL